MRRASIHTLILLTEFFFVVQKNVIPSSLGVLMFASGGCGSFKRSKSHLRRLAISFGSISWYRDIFLGPYLIVSWTSNMAKGKEDSKEDGGRRKTRLLVSPILGAPEASEEKKHLSSCTWKFNYATRRDATRL
jgi:hypothetical protein